MQFINEETVQFEEQGEVASQDEKDLEKMTP